MRKITIFSALVCLFLSVQTTLSAQTTLIHYWNFNNLNTTYNNPNIPDFHATFSTIDTNKANVVYTLMPGTSSTYAGYIDDVTGDTTNARMGDTAGNALRLRNPSDSMELRLYIPTTGYHGNVLIKYALQSSSTKSGQLAHLFDYSLDSGSTWKVDSLNMTIDSVNQTQFIDPSWALISINFGHDTSMNDNSGFVFRIKFAGNTTLTKGNNRFDNITVEINPTPAAVGNVANTAEQYKLFPNPATNMLTVSTPGEEKKTVSIYNLSGEQLMTKTFSGKNIVLNTESLPQGYYYAYISNSIQTKVMTFVKN